MTSPDPPPRGPVLGNPVGRRTMRTARGLVALGVGEVIGKLATLLLIITAVRGLGPVDFGVFAFALALGTLAAIVPSWGFDTLVVQQGSAQPARLPVLLAELLVLRTSLAVPVLVVVGGLVLVSRDGGRAGWASVLVLLACLIDTYADGYRSVATAREAQGRCAVAQIAQRITGAVLVVVAVLTGGGLLGVSAGFLGGSLVGLVGMTVAVARLGVRPTLHSVTRSGVRSLRRGSRVLGVHAVVSMALLRVDAVLLGLLAGDAAVGVYAAAYRLLETVLFVAWTMSRALYPVMTSSVELWRVRRGIDRGIAVLATIFLPYAAVLALRGGDVLTLLYGGEYTAEGVPILLWLAAAPLLFGIANLAGDAILAGGPDARIVVGSVAALVVNLTLNLALIPTLSGLGAAIATTISYAVEAAVLCAFAYRQIGPLTRPRSLLGSIAATVVLAAVLTAPLPLPAALPLAAVAYLLAWSVLTHRLDPEQLSVVRRLFVRERSAHE